MKKLVLGGVFLLMVSLYAHMGYSQSGDVISLKEDAPTTYVVVKGDTLWDISNMYLNDPWLWPEIWHVNPQVDNPHLIFPGDILNLVYIEGRPKLVVKRGRDIKLTPEIRTSSLDTATPAIPLDKINAFLNRSRIVKQGQLEDAPYVLVGADRHIITGAGDQVIARGDFNEEERAYGIYRKGRPYLDPETEELLGFQAMSVAGAQLLALEGSLGTMQLNKTSQEVRGGDRLLVNAQQSINSNFYPSPPPQKTDGYIIDVEGGVSQVGAMDVVILNKGLRDGVAVGNVFAIYKRGEEMRDPVAGDIVKMPDVRSGLLMVFRSFEKASYALVLKATRPLEVMDRVENP